MPLNKAQIIKDKKGKFRWRILDEEGKPLVSTGRTYKTRKECLCAVIAIVDQDKVILPE